MMWLFAIANAFAQQSDEGDAKPVEPDPAVVPGPAATDEPEEGLRAGPPEAGGEIVVTDEREVLRRRAEIIDDLRRFGYEEKKRKDGKTIFSPDTGWHPEVVLYDDGFVLMKRTPARFRPPDAPGLWGTPLVCITVIPCTQIGGQLVSKRKLDAQKGRVAYETDQEMDAWREALVGLYMRERLETGIPDMLDAIWERGEGPGGEIYATHAERRAALWEFWATRTDTKEGQQAREVAGVFIEMVVQNSEWAASDDEVKEAEKACGCSFGSH